MEYESAGKLQSRFSISASTLRNWAETGRIKFIRYSENGKRYYCIRDIELLLCNTTRQVGECNKREVIYARVSNEEQKGDLRRQVEILQQRYPEAQVITDIGPILNYKDRRGLQMLMDLALERKISTCKILDKDRLDRFCFDLLEYILNKQGVKIEVLSMEEDDNKYLFNPSSEFTEDVINVINCLTTQYNEHKSKRSKGK